MTKKRFSARRIRTWIGVAAVSLAVHYLMLILSCAVTGSLTWQRLWDMLVQRWTTPGDATRYLDIAENGYTTEGENAINLVFYPLYPLLVRVLGWVVRSLPAAGVAVSQLCYAGASIMLYEWILLDAEEKSAWTGVLLMALYPFSVFVMGVFSEGVFLLLTVSCLFCIRKKWFVWAGVTGFLAALCRTQGMLLLFPAVYEVVSLRKSRLRLRDAAVLLIPAGFGIYLGINAYLHGDCFQFLKYEAAAPWYQSTQWIGSNLSQHYAMAQQYAGLAGIIYWPQIALYFLILAALLYGLRKRENVGTILYGAVYLGFSYLSGWMISGGRYMLCCVPVYLILGKVKNETARRLLLFASALLCFAYSLFYYKAYAIM